MAFLPERLLDYVRFERTAQALSLDPPLRFRAAVDHAAPQPASGIHALESEFSLSAKEILDIIRERPRAGRSAGEPSRLPGHQRWRPRAHRLRRRRSTWDAFAQSAGAAVV